MPRPELPGFDHPYSPFEVEYTEGANVGYRWYEKQSLTPLFPFGFGLSYTRYAIRNLELASNETITASVDVTNEGSREGEETVQIYATPPANGGPGVMRLIGWSKVDLKPRETRHVSIAADPRLLAHFDTTENEWNIAAGDYTVMAGECSVQPSATAHVVLQERKIKP